MGGIRRSLGTAPDQKRALETAQLRRLLTATPEDTLGGRRDRALLLLGFAGGFRRSELVALELEDLADSEHGLRVRLRRSKTDQEAEGDVKGIPWGSHPETCPVRAVRAWLEASGITEGPLFRAVDRHGRLGSGRLGDRAAAEVVKRAAARWARPGRLRWPLPPRRSRHVGGSRRRAGAGHHAADRSPFAPDPAGLHPLGDDLARERRSVPRAVSRRSAAAATLRLVTRSGVQGPSTGALLAASIASLQGAAGGAGRSRCTAGTPSAISQP